MYNRYGGEIYGRDDKRNYWKEREGRRKKYETREGVDERKRMIGIRKCIGRYYTMMTKVEK